MQYRLEARGSGFDLHGNGMCSKIEAMKMAGYFRHVVLRRFGDEVDYVTLVGANKRGGTKMKLTSEVQEVKWILGLMQTETQRRGLLKKLNGRRERGQKPEYRRL